MALEDMLKALDEEGCAECERILAQAKVGADQIIKEAEKEAVAIRQSHMAKADNMLSAEKSKVLNDASFTVKKAIIQVKDELINRVFNRVDERIQKLRSASEYREVFRKLAAEAVSSMQGEVVISIDQRDQDIAKSALSEISSDFELKTDLECCGGVKVATPDGRITLVNTLDSRLDKARSVLKPDVASILFS